MRSSSVCIHQIFIFLSLIAIIFVSFVQKLPYNEIIDESSDSVIQSKSSRTNLLCYCFVVPSAFQAWLGAHVYIRFNMNLISLWMLCVVGSSFTFVAGDCRWLHGQDPLFSEEIIQRDPLDSSSLMSELLLYPTTRLARRRRAIFIRHKQSAHVAPGSIIQMWTTSMRLQTSRSWSVMILLAAGESWLEDDGSVTQRLNEDVDDVGSCWGDSKRCRGFGLRNDRDGRVLNRVVKVLRPGKVISPFSCKWWNRNRTVYVDVTEPTETNFTSSDRGPPGCLSVTYSSIVWRAEGCTCTTREPRNT